MLSNFTQTKLADDEGIGEAVAIYKDIIDAKRDQFPRGFFKGTYGLENAGEITRYLIERILKIPTDKIAQKVTYRTFEDNHLIGMLKHFKDSPYLAVDNAYPGMFKVWEFSQQTKWKGEKGLKLAKEATQWMIEEKAKIPLDEIPQRVTQKMFADNRLRGMLKRFKSSPYLAIDNAYPGRFKQWEFKKYKGRWQGEKGVKNAIEAIKDMMEKAEIPLDEIPQRVTQKMFFDNGLKGMLASLFGGSPYLAVDKAYPGRFKKWEFRQQKMWQGGEGLKLAKEATIWMIEKEKIPLDEIPQRVTVKMFKDNGLSGMLQHRFKNFLYPAVDNAYPGKFKKEDFQSEKTKVLQYNLNVGKNTEKAFSEYISNYCKNHNLRFKPDEPAGSGRIEFWCEGNNVTVIDITRATTKQAVRNKWRKRDYDKDPRIDRFWIVVNSDKFFERDYEEFNRECPDNVKVYHMLELFNKLGEQPERDLSLLLEAYAMCRLHKKALVRSLYQRALEEGKKHITEEDVQTLLTDF